MPQKPLTQNLQLVLSLLLISQITSVNAAPNCSEAKILCIGPGEEYNTSVEFPDTAFHTAAKNAKPGDTLKIRAGNYVHSPQSPNLTFLEVQNSGTASAPITIEPYGDGKVTFTGFGFPEGTEGPAKNNERLVEVFGDHIVVRNLELRDSSRYGLRIAGSHGLYEGLEVHDCWNDNVIFLNNGTKNVERNTLRNIDTYRSRHAYGIRLVIASSAKAFMRHNIIEDSLAHHNGYQPDGNKVPPISGDAAGGGNSDGIAIAKDCHDAADDLNANNLCDGTIIRGNIVWDNADDGIDVSFGNNSQILDNIAFNNGPEGNKGLKVLRQVQGGLTFMGNVSIANHHGGFELRADGGLKVLHNLALSHPAQEYIIATNNTTGSLFSNNATGKADKRSAETSLPGDLIKNTNWLAASQGDPKLASTGFDINNDIKFSFPHDFDVGQKVKALRLQFQQQLQPTASSPLIDGGTVIAGVHCPFAFDDDNPSNTPAKQAGCRRWLGAAPDIGPYEFGMELINPPMPPRQLKVLQ